MRMRMTLVDFTVEVRDLAVYSDVLLTGPGCVRARITVNVDGRTPLVAATACKRGGAAARLPE